MAEIRAALKEAWGIQDQRPACAPWGDVQVQVQIHIHPQVGPDKFARALGIGCVVGSMQEIVLGPYADRPQENASAFAT